MRISGEVKVRTLFVLVVILSVIFYGMVWIAKSNILVRNGVSGTIVVGSVEELEAACGFEIDVPEVIGDGCTYEFDSISSTAHIWNSKGEMIAVSKPEDKYDVFEYLQREQFTSINNICEYTDIRVRYSYGNNGEDVTLISYNSDDVSYGIVYLGSIDNDEIENILYNTCE